MTRDDLRDGAAAFDRLAPVYDVLTNAPARAEVEADALAALLREEGVESVHEAACGPGHLLRALARRGFRVEGSDASPAMVTRARETLGGAATAVQRIDLARPGRRPAGTADAAICLGNSVPCVGGLADVRRALRTLVRLARPGGRVLIHTQNLDRHPIGARIGGPVRSARIDARESVLLRHYRRERHHVAMDVVLLQTDDDGWHETIVPVRLAVIPPDWLKQALLDAGCSRVRLLADLAGGRFRARTSSDVFALGTLPTVIPLYDENPTRLKPIITLVLIALNVAAYIHEIRGDDEVMGRITFQYGVVPQNLTQDGEVVRRRMREYGLDREGNIHTLGSDWVYVAVAPHEENLPLDQRQPFPWATLLTSMFLHGSLLHLVGNLWFLWIFGNNCEDSMGPLRFTIFYLVTGLVASGIHIVSDPTSVIPTIGASGAISGVLGAYLLLYPKTRVFTLVTLGYFFTFIRIPAVLFLGFWFLMQVTNVFGGGGGGVAWYAHIGGFVAGVALVKLFESGEHRRREETGRRVPPSLSLRRRRR